MKDTLKRSAIVLLASALLALPTFLISYWMTPCPEKWTPKNTFDAYVLFVAALAIFYEGSNVIIKLWEMGRYFRLASVPTLVFVFGLCMHLCISISKLLGP